MVLIKANYWRFVVIGLSKLSYQFNKKTWLKIERIDNYWNVFLALLFLYRSLILFFSNIKGKYTLKNKIILSNHRACN